MPTHMASALPCTFASIAFSAALSFLIGFIRLSLGLLGFFTELIDGLPIALAHAIDEALERQIGNAHQPEVPVLAIQQTTGNRLIKGIGTSARRRSTARSSPV